MGNKMEKQSFLKNHADTMAIMGLNLAIAAILISMWTANTSRVDACNARIDATNLAWEQERIAFYQAWKEESKDFHGRLCAIEEGRKK